MDERSVGAGWFARGVIRSSTWCVPLADLPGGASQLLMCRELGARPTPAELVQHELQDDFRYTKPVRWDSEPVMTIRRIWRDGVLVKQCVGPGSATRQEMLAARAAAQACSSDSGPPSCRQGVGEPAGVADQATPTREEQPSTDCGETRR